MSDVTRETHRFLAIDAPDGCPFPPSEVISGVEFTDRHACYTNADTWYPSWAADGNLYIRLGPTGTCVRTAATSPSTTRIRG